MKRELEPASDSQYEEKKAKHYEPKNIDVDIENDSFFPLLDLPNDELKLILRHLPIEDRLNLKTTCKTAERRLMLLDSSMRRWFLHLTDDNYKRMKISLSKAKLKHIKDGDLEEISISLTINYSMADGDTRIPFVHLILAETLIREWKNNIVSLRLSISGAEFFLLDPEIKMPRLNALFLHDGEHILKTVRNRNIRSGYHNNDSSDSDHSPSDSEDEDNEGENHMVAPKTDRIKIASFLIQHHADTLQELSIQNLDVTITPGLQLTKFIAKFVDCKVVESVLNSSSSSLVVLNLDNSHENDHQSITLSQKLTCLKVLKVNNVNPSDVGLIIRSSYETLEDLLLWQTKPTASASSYELGSIDLKMKTFSTNIDYEDLLTFLKASQKSLENLMIDTSDLVASNTSFNLNGVELKLKKIIAYSVSPKVIASLLKASSKYLKVLDLSDMSSRFANTCNNRFDNNFAQSCGQLQVKHITAYSISPSILASIVSVSNESLEVLKIEYAIHDLSMFSQQFQIQPLKIKEFSALNTPSEIIEAVIKASVESLEDLSISFPRNEDMFDIDGVELKLIRLSLADFPNKFLESVLRSSCRTLQDLEITSNSNTLNVPDLHQWSNMKLPLKKFVADQISLMLVDLILCVSQATLVELTLEKVTIDHGYDNNINNTQFKQLKKFTAIDTDSKLFISVLRSSQTTLEVLNLKHMRVANCSFNVNLNLKRFVGHKIEAHLANLILLSSISSLEYLYLIGTYEMRSSRIKLIEISLSGREGFKDSAHQKNLRSNHIQALETTDQQFPANNYPAMKQLFTGIRKLLLEPAVFHKCVIEKDGKLERDLDFLE